MAEACSKAAFSGSTTSGCSTAARRSRRAGIWNRPTARHGWRCSARTCSKSPPSWRRTTRPTEVSGVELRHGVPADRARDERGRPGRDVGRRGRLLLRCPAPARRHRDAPQSAFDGWSAAALRRDRDRQGAARTAAAADGADGGAHAADAGAARVRSTRPGPATLASPSAVCSGSSTATGCIGF